MATLRRVLAITLTLYWSLILYLTHTPKLPNFAHKMSDKLEHYLAYGMLTGLLFLTLWFYKPKWRFTPLIVFAIVLAYGAFDERTQPYFGRTCDLYDWFADAAAASTAVIILGPIHMLITKRLRAARMEHSLA